MSIGIHIKDTKKEFLEANKHNIELVYQVKNMSEKEFQNFIKPIKNIFEDTYGIAKGKRG